MINIEKYINLKSYSDSPGWLGFYERKCRFSSKLVDESINVFMANFKKYLNDTIIYSSLICFCLNNNIPYKYRLLLNLGCLKLYSDCKDCEYSTPQRFNMKEFLFSDYNLLTNLSYIVMKNNGDIAGHCFFILKELSLLVYPHDDTGFGFIAMDSKLSSYLIVKKFLQNLNNNKFNHQIINI